MDTPTDLTVHLVNEHGDEVDFSMDDGYVGRLNPGKFKVRLRTDRSDLFALQVDGSYNINLSKNRADQGGLWQRTVPVKMSNWNGQKRGSAVPHTETADNNIRILEWNDDGTFKIWLICLVSQDGEFFLVSKRQYEGTALRNTSGEMEVYRNDGSLWDNWPQLNKLIGQLSEEHGWSLAYGRPVRENSSPPSVPTVEWWCPMRQIGSITLPSGKSAHVYWREIKEGRPRRRFLVPGEEVKVETIQKPRKKPGRGETGFKMEAKGVSPMT